MKRLISAFLTLVLLLGMASCSNKNGIVDTFPNTDKYGNSLPPSDIIPEGLTGPHFELSRNGSNVVIIMLDRAMGPYVPYIFKEKPELYEKFAGFTYYKNTMSFGGKTNITTPALYGGYEYTPVEMNKRDTELLVDKHNEALLVMPVLFDQNGFDVTVCDPTYANYCWYPDLSLYDEYPDIDAYCTKGYFGPEDASLRQSYTDKSHSSGLSYYFLQPYYAMVNMDKMTYVTNEVKDTFLIITNDMTHDPMLLQTPDYIPAETVDNADYDATHTERFTVDGRTLNIETFNQMMHYHANISALLRIADWLDYLREKQVYDNTKIIIVSDHGGMNLRNFDDFWLDEPTSANIDDLRSTEMYCPLLMVKEIGSTEFTVSNKFMTNADVPTLATDGLITNPVNPFTGKIINCGEKYTHDQFICISRDWDVTQNNGFTYNGAYWATVKDDIWNPDNWTLYPGWGALKEHCAPMENFK